MRDSSHVKFIGYLRQLGEQHEPLGITQNGEAKAAQQGLASYEETQETLALLRILALGHQDVEAGRLTPADQIVARLRTDRAAEAAVGGMWD